MEGIFLQQHQQLLDDISDLKIRISIFQEEQRQLNIKKSQSNQQISELQAQIHSLQKEYQLCKIKKEQKLDQISDL